MQSARTSKAGADVGFDTSGIEKVAKEEVNREKMLRRESTEDVSGMRRAPTLGIADDPEAEIDEIVAEVKREIEERKRRGSLVQGFDVKKAVEEKLKEFQKR
jgi:lysophospholipid acyltransferase